jgi:hypothetical protein
MEAKEILQKIKLAFNEIIAPAPVAATSVEYDLADGTKVMIDKLEAGGLVTMADGTAVADADYTLADGTIITVVAGAITEVKAPEAPAPEAAPEDMTAKLAAIESMVNERFAAQDQKFAEQEVKLEKANKVIEGLLNLTTLLVEAPQGEPEANKTAFSKDTKKEKELLVDKFRTLSKNFEV